jgi:hypothetical protein
MTAAWAPFIRFAGGMVAAGPPGGFVTGHPQAEVTAGVDGGPGDVGGEVAQDAADRAAW